MKRRPSGEKSKSKVPVTLFALRAVVALFVLAMVVKRCVGSSRKTHTVETDPDGTSVTDSEE
jgi:hypothetical protein